MIKYAKKIPVKTNKVTDIMKIVEKYVPESTKPTTDLFCQLRWTLKLKLKLMRVMTNFLCIL